MKRINLDQMKNMSIDNLIGLYRNGYRLEEHAPITSLSYLPNFSNIHTLQGQLLDPVVNFGKVIVSIGYDAVATSIILNTSEGSKLPDPSIGAYNLVWWNSTDYPDPSDDPNKEIVRCTAKTTDTLTVTRAQEGTSATTKNTVGKIYKMILSPTAKMMSDISSAITARVVKSGDTMTGPLNLPSNGLIVGTNQLIVSGGNVGIGTTSPSEKLTVDGKIMTGAQAVLYGMVPDGQFTASGVNSPGTLALINTNTSNWTTVGEIRFGMNVVWSDPGTATISSQKIGGGSYGHAKGNLRFKIHDEVTGEGGLWRDAMTIISSGNVGIGTTDPAAKLEVNYAGGVQTGSLQGIRLIGKTDTVGEGAGIRLFSGNGTKESGAIISAENTSATNGDLVFRTYPGGSTFDERVRITSNGNVGIGTTTPTSLLDVNGTVQLRGIIGGTGLTVDAGGNVGIGTTSPAAKLDVVHNSSTTPVIAAQISYTGSSEAELQLRRSQGTPSSPTSVATNNTIGSIGFYPYVSSFTRRATIGSAMDGTTDSTKLYFGVTPAGGSLIEAMTIKSSGNVGIGATNPTAKLEVAGHVFLNGVVGSSDISLNTTDAIYFNGLISGLNIASPSVGKLAIIGGNVGIGTASPTSLLDVHGTAQLRGYVGGTGLTVDAGGNVGIGTVSPSMQLEIAKSADYTIAGLSTWSATAYYHAPNLELQRSKSSTIGAHTAVVANDYLGNIVFQGSDGAGFITAAGIRADAEGIITNNIVPGRLVFRTMNSAGTFTEAMRIDSSGNVGIGTSTPEALGIELVVDGDMEFDNVIYWGNYNSPTTIEKNTISPINGVRDLHIVGDTANDGIYQSYMPITGKYYKIVFSYKVVSGILVVINGAKSLGTFTGIGTATKYDISDGNPNIIFITSGGAGEFYIDDVSIKEVIVGSLAINGVLRVAGTGNSYISGNVGIGTTGPTTRLHILGSNYAAINLSEMYNSPVFRIQPRTDMNDSVFVASAGVSYVLGIQGAASTSTTKDISLQPFGGNVGIGTTTPTSLLDVNGTVQLRGIVGGTGLTVDAGGKVGIGTTSPATKLHLLGNGDTNAIRLSSTTDRTGGFQITDADDNESMRIILEASSGSGYIQFQSGSGVDPTALSTKMVINSNTGNVGIGTTNPSGNLHILGSSGNPASITIETLNRLNDAAIALKTGSGTWVIGAGTAVGGDNLVFYEADGGNPRMVIQNSGNVGIGTTSPTAALHISNPGYGITGRVFQWSGATTGTQYFDGANSGANLVWGMEGSAGAVGWPSSLPYTAFFGNENDRPVQFGAGSDIRMTILSNGNVGIGTTDPAAKISLVTATTAAGGIDFGGDVTLYRSAANVLKTDDNLELANKYISGVTNFQGADGYGAVYVSTYPRASNDSNIVFRTTDKTASPALIDRMTITGKGGAGASSIDITEPTSIINGGTSAGLTIVQNGVASALRIDNNSTSYSLIVEGTTSSDFIILKAGNVGIGTDSPTSLLDVNGTVQLRGIIGGNGLTVDAGGKVGIGTTSPRTLLDVTSGTPNTPGDVPGVVTFTSAAALPATGTLSLESNSPMDATTGSSITFKARYLTTDTPGAMFASIRGMKESAVSGNLNGLMTFHVRTDGLDANFASEKMRIVGSTGNVGIGTTNPLSKLHINGLGSESVLLSGDSSGAWRGLGFDIDNTGVQKLHSDYGGGGVDSDFVLGTFTNRTNQLYLKTNGNVGIGTASPSQTLEVNGNVKVVTGLIIPVGTNKWAT